MNKKYFLWGGRIILAIVLLQTLFFKFGGAEVSKYIFGALGVEPWGRIATGILELTAAILVLIPRTSVYGAVIALFIMVGAIFSHLAVLGIIVQEDGGQLFMMAIGMFILSAYLVIAQKEKLKKLF